MNDTKKSPAKPQATASTDKAPAKSSASPPSVKTPSPSTPIAKRPPPPVKSKSGGGFLALLMSVTALGVSAYLYLMMEKPELLGIEKNTGATENHIDRIEELERRLDNRQKTPCPKTKNTKKKSNAWKHNCKDYTNASMKRFPTTRMICYLRHRSYSL